MEEINNILAKHFSGIGLTDNEKHMLSKWTEENQSEYKAIEASWQSTAEFGYKTFNTSKAWDKIDARIVEEKETKTFTLKPILKYAIAASIAIILGIGAFNFFKSNSNKFIAFTNDSEAVKTVELPDGSTIYLANHSTLKYQADFKNNRNLELNGEAFFEVARDEQHPFIIQTNYGEVEVLGTSFNVNTKNDRAFVSVASGLVALRNDNESIKLKANQAAYSDSKHVSKVTEVNLNFLSWKTGEFKFEDDEITKVVDDLKTVYDNEILISDGIDPNCKFTGTFKNQEIEHIIEAIALSCDLEFIIENDTIVIK